MTESIISGNLLVVFLIGVVPTLILYFNLGKVQKFLQNEIDKESKITHNWDKDNPILIKNEHEELSFNVKNPPKEGEKIRLIRFRLEHLKTYRNTVSQAKNLMFILFIVCVAGVGWILGSW